MHRFFWNIFLTVSFYCSTCTVSQASGDLWSLTDEEAYGAYVKFVAEAAGEKEKAVNLILQRMEAPVDPDINPRQILYSHQIHCNGSGVMDIVCDPRTPSGQNLLLDALKTLNVGRSDLYAMMCQIKEVAAFERYYSDRVSTYLLKSELINPFPVLINDMDLVSEMGLAAEKIIYDEIESLDRKNNKDYPAWRKKNDPSVEYPLLLSMGRAYLRAPMDGFSLLDASGQDQGAKWSAVYYYLRHKAMIKMAMEVSPAFKEVGEKYLETFNKYGLPLSSGAYSQMPLVFGWFLETKMMTDMYSVTPEEVLYEYLWNFHRLKLQREQDYFEALMLERGVKALPASLVQTKIVMICNDGHGERLNHGVKPDSSAYGTFVEFVKSNKLTRDEMAPLFVRSIVEIFMVQMLNAVRPDMKNRDLIPIVDKNLIKIDEILALTDDLSKDIYNVFRDVRLKFWKEVGNPFADVSDVQEEARVKLSYGSAFNGPLSDLPSEDLLSPRLWRAYQLEDRFFKMHVMINLKKLLAEFDNTMVDSYSEKWSKKFKTFCLLVTEAVDMARKPTVVVLKKPAAGVLSARQDRMRKKLDGRKPKIEEAVAVVQPVAAVPAATVKTNTIPQTELVKKVYEWALLPSQTEKLMDWAVTDAIDTQVLARNNAQLMTQVKTSLQALVNVLLLQQKQAYEFEVDSKASLHMQTRDQGGNSYSMEWSGDDSQLENQFRSQMAGSPLEAVKALILRDRLLSLLFIQRLLTYAATMESYESESLTESELLTAVEDYPKAMEVMENAYAGVFVQFLKDQQKLHMARRLSDCLGQRGHLKISVFDSNAAGASVSGDADNRPKTFHALIVRLIKKMTSLDYPVLFDGAHEIRCLQKSGEGAEGLILPIYDDWQKMVKIISEPKEKEIADLKQRLASTQEIVKNALEKLRQAKQESTELRQELESTKEKLAVSQSQYEISSKALAAQAAEVEKQRLAIESYRQTVDKTSKEIKEDRSIRKANSALKEHLQTLEGEHQKQKELFSTVSKEFLQEKRRNEKLAESIVTIQQQLTDMQNDQKAANADVLANEKKLQEALEAAKQELQGLEKNLEDTRCLYLTQKCILETEREFQEECQSESEKREKALVDENQQLRADIESLKATFRTGAMYAMPEELAMQLMTANKTIQVMHESNLLWRNWVEFYKGQLRMVYENPLCVPGTSSMKDADGRVHHLTLEQQFKLASLAVYNGFLQDPEVLEMLSLTRIETPQENAE
ncbi:MAG: hypothetical protein KBB83_06015 [Alphaproteobacteria bacterium]|nr:hypothetical protein [Alphaproteobacteria bacterium]